MASVKVTQVSEIQSQKMIAEMVRLFEVYLFIFREIDRINQGNLEGRCLRLFRNQRMT